MSDSVVVTGVASVAGTSVGDEDVVVGKTMVIALVEKGSLLALAVASVSIDDTVPVG